jgi:DNA-binding winged helix-turn-helix (wHTH) protein/TolB-like protein
LESPIVRFGDCEFDLDRKELRRNGSPVRLQSQPALVLAALLQRPGEVVSREELQSAIWGGDTFVDFERGLNFCMAQIRAALGDDAARPLYIRTVPRKGYQFIAPVHPPSVASPAPPPAPERSARRSIVLWTAAAVLILSAAAIAPVWLRARHHVRPGVGRAVPILAVVRFDNDTKDAELQTFADGLTDDLVVQLTTESRGRYRVVGNAPIVRVPREQRDLKAIGQSLGARYVVIGQVQGGDSKVLILAHLIRLSDLTHVWVVRTDGDLGDALRLQSRAAGEIAAQFADQMSKDPDTAASFPPANR